MPGKAWDLNAEEVLALPVDELALALLSDLQWNQERNTYNWLNAVARGGYLEATPGQRGLVTRVLEEAWAWLYRKGLIAQEWKENAPGWFHVTREGVKVWDDGLAHLRAAERLDVELHPLIEPEARPQFLLGKYDIAAFAALKQVEVRMRALAGAPNDLVGVKLARMAWAAEKPPGPLTDSNLEGGEQLAMQHLFAGAMGVFKNPPSHRQVTYEDPTRAAEVVLFADLLMRILDDAEKRIAGS